MLAFSEHMAQPLRMVHLYLWEASIDKANLPIADNVSALECLFI